MIKNTIRSVLGLILLQFLVACGSGGDVCDFYQTCVGGGGGTGGGGTVGITPTISLSLLDSGGTTAISSLSAGETGLLVATVTGATGQTVEVAFTSDLGAVGNSGTNITNGLLPNKTAVDITMPDPVIDQIVHVTASVSIGGTTYEATLMFQAGSSVAPPTPTSPTISLSLLYNGGAASSLDAGQTGTLRATMTGMTGSVEVKFVSDVGTVGNSGSVLASGSTADIDLVIPVNVASQVAHASATVTYNGNTYSTGSFAFQVNSVANATTSPVVTLTLEDTGGNPISGLSAGQTGVIVATVTNAPGVQLEVSYSTDVGTLANGGTNLSDSGSPDNIAMIDLDIPSNVTDRIAHVTASVTVNSIKYTSTALAFQVSSTVAIGGPGVTVELQDGGGAPASFLNAGDTGKLVATVSGAVGQSVEVFFTTDVGTVGNSGSNLSDALNPNEATVDLTIPSNVADKIAHVTARVVIGGITYYSDQLSFQVYSAGSSTPTSPSVSLALQTSGGAPTAILNAGDTGKLVATLTNLDGQVIEVKFTSNVGTVGNSGSSLSDGSTTPTPNNAQVDLVIPADAVDKVATATAKITLANGSTYTSDPVQFQVYSVSSPSPTAPTVTLALTPGTVSPGTPGTLTATVDNVTDSSVVVNFSATKGTVGNGGSAIADTSTLPGMTSVPLTIGDTVTAGVGTAKATIIVNGITYSSPVISYQVDTLPAGQLTLELLDITSTPTTTISKTESGTLRATLGSGILPDPTQPVVVTFSSNLGTVSPTTALSDGSSEAHVDLFAGNDVGAGTATATVTIGSATYTASVNFQIATSAATGNNVIFESATPTEIALQGTGTASGSSETSIVKFQVIDTAGNGVAGQTVTFVLDNALGGASINPASAISDSSGYVSTLLSSGTIHGTTSVTAQLRDAGNAIIDTQKSADIGVSTGLPDQDSFTLGATTFNVEGWSWNNVKSDIIVNLADHFNNSVPDGTVVSFTTEGGAITSQCTTTNGGCTVQWQSQSPRPQPADSGSISASGQAVQDAVTNGTVEVDQIDHLIFATEQPLGGRATVTAYAIGEESFSDTDSNGYYDLGEPLTNREEVYMDYNEDGTFDTGASGGTSESYLDYNSDSFWTDLVVNPDDDYNGTLCLTPGSNGCSAQRTIYVWDNLVIVMSGSDPVVSLEDLGLGQAYLCVSDINAQKLPYGTTIKIDYFVDFNGNATETISVPNTNAIGPQCIVRSYAGSGTTAGSGVRLTVTTPKGIRTVTPLIDMRDTY